MDGQGFYPQASLIFKRSKRQFHGGVTAAFHQEARNWSENPHKVKTVVISEDS